MTAADADPEDDYGTGDLFGKVEDDTDEVAVVDGLKISVLEKSGLALTLIADHIFSPALVLSEFIYLDKMQVRGKTLVELGCGTGLVGLMALKHGASFVCLTDYDDESILSCPRLNLTQNSDQLVLERCSVEGHIWGNDTSTITRHGRYDIVVLADILWYVSSHTETLRSVDGMLKEDGEVWIASGKYTTCALDFFALAGNAWTWEAVAQGDRWEMANIQGVRNLDERKQNCLCWKMTRTAGVPSEPRSGSAQSSSQTSSSTKVGRC